MTPRGAVVDIRHHICGEVVRRRQVVDGWRLLVLRIRERIAGHHQAIVVLVVDLADACGKLGLLADMGGEIGEERSFLGTTGAQNRRRHDRSEENKSELQSLMRITYAVFCLKKK